MSRLKLVSDAVRPKMNGRVMLAGQPGAGKTWTSLSIARHLVGPSGKILVIDTERESALTYADVFEFQHLPWRPPYDPSELTQVLNEIGTGYTDCVIIDSGSHFWKGIGGTLDIAGSRAQGWEKARPIQEALVEAICGAPCHVIICVRSKETLLISDGGKRVEMVGVQPIQDSELAFEVNISLSMERNHTITVEKSRTPAVPVNRLYQAGFEGKLAADYAEWLEGGIPPANREDVDAIVAMFAGIVDRDLRNKLKNLFIEEFGHPHALVAAQVDPARQWLIDNGSPVGEGPAAASQPEPEASRNDDSSSSIEEAKPESSPEPPEAPSGTSGPTDQEEVSTGHREAEKPLTMGDLAKHRAHEVADRAVRVNEYCMTQPVEIVEALGESHGARFLEGESRKARRAVIATVLIGKGWDPDVADAGWREMVSK